MTREYTLEEAAADYIEAVKAQAEADLKLSRTHATLVRERLVYLHIKADEVKMRNLIEEYERAQKIAMQADELANNRRVAYAYLLTRSLPPIEWGTRD